MHFLFSLLRINGLYMFRALLAHPQEVHTSWTWYITCVLYQLAAPDIPSAACVALPEDEQVMLEKGRDY
jgi:hypothetical protein